MCEVLPDSLPVIGKGVSGVIYRYDTDKVLKVFNQTYSREQVERAYKIAKYVWENGIPTPKVFEFVNCGSSYGIVSEFIDAQPTSFAIADGKLQRHDVGVRMGKLLKQVHELEGADFIPSQRQMVGEIYERCAPYITEDMKEEFLDFLDSFPGGKTVLHGDFHENNIMVREGEFILLDLDSLCIGSPVFEFQQSFTTYRNEIPEEWKKKLRYSDEEAKDFIRAFLGSYFETEDVEILEQYDYVFTRLAQLNLFAAKILQAPPETDPEKLYDYVKEGLPKMRELIRNASQDFARLPWK